MSHNGGRVTIADVVRYDPTDEKDVVSFSGLRVDLPESDYLEAVVACAREARSLFVNAAKRFADEFDAQQYGEFLAEFDQLLARWG